MAADANTNVPHLYHTMSALVSQRQASPRVPVPGMPIRASVGTAASPADQSHSVSPVRLTEALLAAADDVTSSAEKLPVSHRLPVSRSVFDSDEGETCFCHASLTITRSIQFSYCVLCQKFAWEHSSMQTCCKQDAWVCLLAVNHDPERTSHKGCEAHHTGCLAEHHDILADLTSVTIVACRVFCVIR